MAASPPAESFRLGEFEVHPRSNEIVSPRGTERIEAKAMEVLCTLHRAQGEIVTRDQLLDEVWESAAVSEGVLGRAIHLIRRALGDSAREPRYLETVPRRGFRLLGSSCGEEPAPSNSEEPLPVVAVLPFANLTGPDDEYYVDGVTELLITELARLAGLRVISRTSSMVFKNETALLPELAERLGASHIVEGTVQRRDERLRLTCQLIEADSDTHLWAKTYDRETGDLLQVQSEIASTVADAIGAKLEPLRITRSPSGPVDRQVTEYFLKGLHAFSQRSWPSFQTAIRRFEQALDLQPDHAPSLTALGQIYVTAALYTFIDPVPAFAKARQVTTRAIECDPESGDALGGLAAIRMFHDWDFEAAQAGFERSLELSASNAIVRLGYADGLVTTGHAAEAIEMIESAVRLDPLDAGMVMNRGDIFMFAGKTEAAIDFYLAAQDLDPSQPRVRYRLAHGYRQLGDQDNARKVLDESKGVPGMEMWSVLETAQLSIQSSEDGAREARALLERESLPAIQRAALAARLDDTDAAIDFLALAIEQRSPWLIFVGVDPDLASLHRLPGFRALIRAAGLKQFVPQTD